MMSQFSPFKMSNSVKVIKSFKSVEIFKPLPSPSQTAAEQRFQKWKRRIFLKPRRQSVIFNSFKTIGFLGVTCLTINFIFFWDFGDQKHVFTNLRQRTNRWFEHRFMTLTDQEREYITEINRNRNLQ